MDKQQNSWEAWQNNIINPFLSSDEGKRLINRVKASRENSNIFPNPDNIFDAFYYTPIDNIKIVIIGLDPYNKGNHAHGLAFSSKQANTPPSLRVIFKELRRDLYSYMSDDQWKQFFPNNDLTNWAKRGILLLNRYLTVKEGEAKSHAEVGWDGLINKVFDFLNNYDKPIVFILWGKDAQELEPLIQKDRHEIIKGYHPAVDCYNPVEPKFHGCGHFSQALKFLKENRPEDCQNQNIDITKYFKTELFNDFKKLIQSNEGSYPYSFKDDEEFINHMVKGLTLSYNYGIDLTLTK